MRYRNDVIWLVLRLYIRVNPDMMLAWDYVSWHTARSKLVMIVANTQMADKTSGFKVCALLPLQLNLRCMQPFHNSIFIGTFYQ